MGVKDESGVSIPLYEDLRKKLLKDYADLAYYEPFPSEREICDFYGVSRPTVRSALNRLEQDGDIIRLPRKGTFFLRNKPFLNRQISLDDAFYNNTSSHGRKTTSRVLFQNITRANDLVAEKLGVEPGTSVFRLERLHYRGGILLSLTDSHLPAVYLDYLKTADFTGCSLYDILSSHGIELYRGVQHLEIKPADEYESFQLEVDPGTPLSVLSSQMFTPNGELIEYVVTKSKAYMTSFDMEVYPQQNSKAGGKSHGTC